MIRTCTAEAYAKINIGLEIGARKPDGYHTIFSIFQSVSLCDTLYLEVKGSPGSLLIEGIEDCLPDQTTVAKAVRNWRNKYRIHDGLRIVAVKRIPVMAGMGGGSADAAATLLALDRLFDRESSLAELSTLASSIGADVPFFLYGGAAFVSGVGEIIQPIPSRKDFGVLIAKPGFGVSTAEAYAALDRSRENGSALPASRERDAWTAVYKEGISDWSFTNSFESLLEKKHPLYSSLRRRLREMGARFVALTGSGSTMFGIFDSAEKAREAEKAFSQNKILQNGADDLSCVHMHALEPLETSIVLR